MTRMSEKVPRSAAHWVKIFLTTIVLFSAGCTLGPKYQKPTVPVPPSYKELTPGSNETQIWKTAQPNDGGERGKWWQAFNDAELNALEERASVSNQNIAAAAANFLAARALVREARSQYLPTVGTKPSIVNSRPSPAQFGGITPPGASSGAGLTVKSFNAFSLPFDASWEPDFWGRIRNSVRSSVFAAQASAADLENVRLSAEAELAVDYYQLRAQDALKQVLDSTVAAYQESLDITRSRDMAGLETEEAVAQADAQLKAAQARDTNLGILRSHEEHAIAVLIGQPASSFSLPVEPLKANVPAIPVGIPSELLERRPDIAAAERAVAQANAQIGIAKAAYFPSVILSASGGLGNTSITDWFTWPSRFWSTGPSLVETLFDAGLRRATVQQFQASYDQTVANYRQSVLTAFQQVEDNLASLRIASQDIEQQDAAVEAAGTSLRVATVRYRAGVDPYLNVITAQTILQGAEETAVNFRMQKMVASVQLIKALGGGWDASRIPSPKELGAKISPGSNARP